MVRVPMIDMKQTGQRIQKLCRVNGYSVRELQSLLQIGCPQSIYNWFHGKTLPSLDHLFALSILLQVPMNWLVVAEPSAYAQYQRQRCERIPQMHRMAVYRRRRNLLERS